VSAVLDAPAVLPNAVLPGLGGSPRVREVLARASGGGRLSWDDGLALFREATLLEAGGAADAVRRRLHPPGRVT
jgi:2-iminoacetate synthase ThiH